MKLESYINLVKNNTPEPSVEKRVFSTSGKLCLLFIEFRNMEIIPYNLYNICNVYGNSGVGLTIVHSGENKEQIYEATKDWKNVKYIQEIEKNKDVHFYDTLITSADFWKRFTDFEYVLTNTWDSYIFRKIPEKFFHFDYVGGVCNHVICRRDNQIFNICGDKCGCGNCVRKQSTFNYHPYDVIYNIGNGGFCLRKLKTTIDLCIKKPHRGEPDDVYFSMSYLTQPSRLESSEFSVQDWNYNGVPVGCHKIWENQPDEYTSQLLHIAP